MAGKEEEKSWVRKKSEAAAWWLAEKSMYITVPLAIFAIVSGTAVAAGLAALAVDAAELVVIQQHKNKEKNKPKEQVVFQASGA